MSQTVTDQKHIWKNLRGWLRSQDRPRRRYKTPSRQAIKGYQAKK